VLDERRESLDPAFARLSRWTRHPSKEHEWYGPGGVQVDVLPASADLIARGELRWPSGHTMSLVGFEHVFARHQAFDVEGLSISVARPEVIALLKIVAYLDRPSEREHHLADLLFLTEEFVPPDDERRWSDDIVERQLAYDDVGAYVLGSAMSEFLGERDRAAIREFFQRVGDSSDTTLARLLRVAPRSCAGSEDQVLARLKALRSGIRM
jgi:predicted nucleotidyltransferase